LTKEGPKPPDGRDRQRFPRRAGRSPLTIKRVRLTDLPGTVVPEPGLRTKTVGSRHLDFAEAFINRGAIDHSTRSYDRALAVDGEAIRAIRRMATLYKVQLLFEYAGHGSTASRPPRVPAQPRRVVSCR
jgi:hypothetical protein